MVDDEPNICSGLSKGLADEVAFIDVAHDADEALEKFDAKPFSVVISDVRLPGRIDGLELVSRLLHMQPSTTVIVITAHGTVETAVDAMRRGAFDFITKPVDLNLIRQQVRRAVEHFRLKGENQSLREKLADVGEITGIVGNCSAIKDVFRQIRQVAGTDATVLIHGESGTGKELVARALHDLSNRSGGPFVPINLGALPESLLESELFGHEKGAFTGAVRRKAGCFEQACGGSLFLDEVTEMSPKSQLDLLRVLETGSFCRIGGEEMLQSDARIISATNKNIQELIEDGSFREDLYYRLNVIPIDIPSLRQRKEDIPLLVEHFLQLFCQRHQRPPKRFASAALQALVAFAWPGNIRQLRNLIERLVVTVTSSTIEPSDLPTEILPDTVDSAAPRLLSEVVEEAEKKAIQEALATHGFHREQTAKAIGVSVRTLHYKMSRYGLH
ncbi:MAG: sigma-54 dependent transcriptional regulator [Pirellulaceae bacterium]